MLLRQGQGPSWVSLTQRWSKAAALTLTWSRSHPLHHHFPLWHGHEGTRMQAQLSSTRRCNYHSPCCTWKGFSSPLLLHRDTGKGCPSPAVEPIQIPLKIGHHLSPDHPSTRRNPCRAAEHFTQALPFGSFCLWQQTIMFSIQCAQVDGKGKSLSTGALGKRNEHISSSV